MEYLKTFWDWLVKSSKDPEQLSLTVRGFLVSTIPAILFFGPHFGVHADTESLQNLFELIRELVVQLGGAFGAIVTAYGLGRKIWNTVKGYRVKPE